VDGARREEGERNAASPSDRSGDRQRGHKSSSISFNRAFEGLDAGDHGVSEREQFSSECESADGNS
jgi:hypothetical protein